ncbi:fimbrillin family protein [Leyella stercorea]|uniref:fimbrillin family protein n=1 Tax=Leyella stercorea TaxID=363265 RepID=UPI00267722B7|nr:fimbrillin family protein [Leyella stercorea]
MKKILYSVFMLATMMLAACSDDTTEPAVKRGMVLKANVENTDTRATMTKNKDVYKFAFATNDMVKVGNDQVEGYYTFTNDGTVFTSADALQTTTPATWCAYFPGETINLANQSGDFADVATKYALAGATATPTTGSDGLTVTMKAKAAVLRIVGVNKDEKLDISVKTADDGKYVSGLKAVKNSEGFSVETSDTKVSLLSKQGAGVYYVVVPAGVKISVSNGDKSLYSGDKPMSTTKADGLKAGKYYTLTTGKTTGKADATINGVKVNKEWVQLWPGGPKFAKENVAEKINFTEARKTGDAYVWGANWRTPTTDELNKFFTVKYEDEKYVLYPINTTGRLIEKNGEYGLLLTGVKPGYTGNTLFLPAGSDSESHFIHSLYLTSEYYSNGSDHSHDSDAQSFSYYGNLEENVSHIGFSFQSTVTPCMVRPVLVEK